jgi:hypothetical protein
MELMLFFALLAHFVGDYVLQNDWMANEKTKSTPVALLHVCLYSTPFLFIVGVSWELLIIAGTHFFIDRFRLATYWIKLINWNWKSKNFGFADDKPMWMSVWLMIIYDNVFHVLCNTAAIYFFNR